jgi:hypothetical protein
VATFFTVENTLKIKLKALDLSSSEYCKLTRQWKSRAYIAILTSAACAVVLTISGN